MLMVLHSVFLLVMVEVVLVLGPPTSLTRNLWVLMSKLVLMVVIRRTKKRPTEYQRHQRKIWERGKHTGRKNETEYFGVCVKFIFIKYIRHFCLWRYIKSWFHYYRIIKWIILSSWIKCHWWNIKFLCICYRRKFPRRNIKCWCFN